MNPHLYYLHRISPFVIRFGESFGLRWYGLSYVAGFAAGFLLLRYLSKRGRLQLTAHDLDELLTVLIVGVLVGARLGYVLFYAPSLLVQFSSSLPFWGALAINQGGMSSHGGFIGVAIAVYYFARRRKVSWLHVGDAVVMVAPVGLFFGRIANFINGELYGCPTNVPWAVCFPSEIMNWSGERLSQLTLLLTQNGFHFDKVESILTAIRVNDAVAAIAHPLLTPRHPSQLYEAFLEGVVLFCLLWFFGVKKNVRPGAATALFFFFYALLRIAGEQFREPDADIGYQWLNLTRGQWLSIFMLGAAAVFWRLSRTVRPAAAKAPNAHFRPPKSH